VTLPSLSTKTMGPEPRVAVQYFGYVGFAEAELMKSHCDDSFKRNMGPRPCAVGNPARVDNFSIMAYKTTNTIANIIRKELEGRVIMRSTRSRRSNNTPRMSREQQPGPQHTHLMHCNMVAARRLLYCNCQDYANLTPGRRGRICLGSRQRMHQADAHLV